MQALTYHGSKDVRSRTQSHHNLADIITHRMKLEDAAEAYDIFNKKQENCRKVVLTP